MMSTTLTLAATSAVHIFFPMYVVHHVLMSTDLTCPSIRHSVVALHR